MTPHEFHKMVSAWHDQARAYEESEGYPTELASVSSYLDHAQEWSEAHMLRKLGWKAGQYVDRDGNLRDFPTQAQP